MIVPLCGFPSVVQMLVVLVMIVRMGVSEPFMLVEVPVHFSVKEKHPRKHD